MQPFRENVAPGSDLTSVQGNLSNRVPDHGTIDPEPQIKHCITQDVELDQGRDDTLDRPFPVRIEPVHTLVRSCCGGLSRQSSDEPQGTKQSPPLTEIVCTTMSEEELQDIDIVTAVEPENVGVDQLNPESLSRAGPFLFRV